MRSELPIDGLGRFAPTLLCVTDARGNLEFMNERWMNVLGAPLSALLGSGWRSFVHAEDVETLNRDFRAALATGEPYRGEFRMRHADGGYRWIEVRAEPERDAAGSIVRWFAAGHDIDAQCQHVVRLARTRRQFQFAQAHARTRFSVQAGHPSW